MERPEAHRNKWALGLATTFSLVIFVAFGFYKGYLSIQNTNQVEKVAIVPAEKAPSPIENSKTVFGEIFTDFKSKYTDLKESMAAVFVPFITSIEVYDNQK